MDRRGDEGRRSGTGRGRAPGETRACDARTRVVEDRLSRASRDRAGEARPRPRVGDARLLQTDARGEQESSVGTGRTVRIEPRDGLRDDARDTSAPIPTRFAEGRAENRHRRRLRWRAGRHCSGARIGPESPPPRKTLRSRGKTGRDLAAGGTENSRSRKARGAPSFRRQ